MSHFSQLLALYSWNNGLMCKVFTSSLSPTAMRFNGLKKSSIHMSFEELIQAFGGKERPYVLIPIDIRSCTMRSVEITKKCSGKHDRKEVRADCKAEERHMLHFRIEKRLGQKVSQGKNVTWEGKIQLPNERWWIWLSKSQSKGNWRKLNTNHSSTCYGRCVGIHQGGTFKDHLEQLAKVGHLRSLWWVRGLGLRDNSSHKIIEVIHAA